MLIEEKLKALDALHREIEELGFEAGVSLIEFGAMHIVRTLVILTLYAEDSGQGEDALRVYDEFAAAMRGDYLRIYGDVCLKNDRVNIFKERQ
jgi:hypothetical protein